MQTKWGVRFDRRVNAVSDLNCDPSGGSPSNQLFSVDGDTLVYLPGGTYRITDSVYRDLRDENIGFYSDGNATVEIDAGFRKPLLHILSETFHWEGIDIDQRADNAATGFRIKSQSGGIVRDTEFVGRGHAGTETVPNAFELLVYSENKTPQRANASFLFDNVVAKKGSGWGHYKHEGGRTFCLIPDGGSVGTVKFRDCQVEEFGNNAIYAAGTASPVQVEGGSWWNNNVTVCSRAGGEDSYVRGATIGVSVSRYSGPRTAEETSFQMRGVRVDGKKEAYRRPGTMVVEDCDFHLTDLPGNNVTAGVEMNSISGAAKVSNCRFALGNTWGVFAEEVGNDSQHPPMPGPNGMEVVGCSFTGPGTKAVRGAKSRSFSVVRDSCVTNDKRLERVDTANISTSGCPVVGSARSPPTSSPSLPSFPEFSLGGRPPTTGRPRSSGISMKKVAGVAAFGVGIYLLT